MQRVGALSIELKLMPGHKPETCSVSRANREVFGGFELGATVFFTYDLGKRSIVVTRIASRSQAYRTKR